MERIARVFKSPESAERATRDQYRAMTPNERVALTVELQRYYYEHRADTPRRLARVVTIIDRSSR